MIFFHSLYVTVYSYKRTSVYYRKQRRRNFLKVFTDTLSVELIVYKLYTLYISGDFTSYGL